MIERSPSRLGGWDAHTKFTMDRKEKETEEGNVYRTYKKLTSEVYEAILLYKAMTS